MACQCGGLRAQAGFSVACVGVVEWRHFAALRDESDARFSVALRERKFWCSFTATRQQSLSAMQAAARKS
ncbi:TPA: hypothetical protein ACWPY2_002164 [Escherichia coli]